MLLRVLRSLALFARRRALGSKRKAAEVQLTKNFTLQEFFSGGQFGAKTEAIPPGFIPNVQRLAEQLQVIRDEVGALKVASGYRTPEHNRKVGGSPKSQHLQAKAADLHPLEVSVEKLQETVKRLIDEGKIHNGGLGLYDWGVHYDIRDNSARWGYRTIKRAAKGGGAALLVALVAYLILK